MTNKKMRKSEFGMRSYLPVSLSPRLLVFLALFFSASAVNLSAQEPKPGPARTAQIPAVKETKLKNGLTVAVVEKRNVPLVTVQLLVRSGANAESMEKAGLADITASMLTKGTKTRTAEQIAEQIEFLGGSIFSGAGWNNSSVTVSVTSDKLDQAMAILADVVLNPTFPQSELDLLRSQAIDGLTYNLTQPGFLANYVASKYSFGEHPAGGTIGSLNAFTIEHVTQFYQKEIIPFKSVLIFSGDISQEHSSGLAEKYFGTWKNPGSITTHGRGGSSVRSNSAELLRRILVIDLPNSGQASVNYLKQSYEAGRNKVGYYPATVLNSLVGGGYSSRLNQEIRIKRGLSYGAGSSFSWRLNSTNFGTRTQTKNESAPEVAELVLTEIKRLIDGEIPEAELTPRKSVLTGGFGRNIETTGGLVSSLADLYTFDIPTIELNKYMTSVNAVTDKQIREFAAANMLGGDIIIVGDYSLFKDDLA
ncbi:MAG: insulinase family protein, partial [Acidobacteria bacterium]|nr:insulinase family protein [Acidobacteriota bacterium]